MTKPYACLRLWTTPVITLFFWSLAIPLVLWVLPDIPFTFLLALLPLFVLRSLTGAYQIRLQNTGLAASLAPPGWLNLVREVVTPSLWSVERVERQYDASGSC